MDKILLYHHGGSYNHGCEAIVRSICNILRKYEEMEINVASENLYQDREYFSNENINFYSSSNLLNLPTEKRRKINSSFAFVFKKIPFFKIQFKNTCNLAKKSNMIISIGGDVYSYGRATVPSIIDIKLRDYSRKSVLWGCSINKDVLDIKKDKLKIENLKAFDLIIARESITYNSLKDLGLTNIKLYPDPAFSLDYNENIVDIFKDKQEIIGINISPLIENYENKNEITMKSYIKLINYILKNTFYNILLIPHVTSVGSNDIESLENLANSFSSEKRVVILEEHNCIDLKGYISKCKIFIGSRTHATIAAYSTCVPTLVVGYSVKALGIAKDIFSTYENYVIPVQDLTDEDELIEKYKWIEKNYDSIKQHLIRFMPSYIKKSKDAGKEIYDLLKFEDKNGV